MKIYTKTGDKGETGIIGARISKSSDIINLIGNLDELNALLGIVANQLQAFNYELRDKTKNIEDQESFKVKKLKPFDSAQGDIVHELEGIQSDIFGLGAIVAGGKIKIDLEKRTAFLENSIDSMDKDLKPLQNFILPGGSLVSSYLHLARAVCRRTERSVVSVMTVHPSGSLKVTKEILIYLNRLSDYFFVLARFVNHNLGQSEQIWK